MTLKESEGLNLKAPHTALRQQTLGEGADLPSPSVLPLFPLPPSFIWDPQKIMGGMGMCSQSDLFPASSCFLSQN